MELAFISLYGQQVRVIYAYQNVALRQHKSKSVGGSLVIIRISGGGSHSIYRGQYSYWFGKSLL